MTKSKTSLFAFRSFFKKYLDLRKDKDDEQLTVESIKKGVVFKGANLWILIFATFMASLGLSVNSTAVIIGAMLISPLMGPIMGIGLAVGTNDFDLMKRSFKSFLIATLFSVVTSTVFFLLSPLAEAQSELLARTSPNIYDVFIALFGGLAGVVALSTKEKGNVIPGVAIATALMPPLCTAGYGIATGNPAFFFGAFYLYFINTVFISVATYLGVRLMHFRQKEFVDKTRELRVRKYIVFIVVATMVPALYLTVGIIKDTVFKGSATRFITEELNFDNTQIINRTLSYNDSTNQREIKVVMIGSEVPEASLGLARKRMSKYKLDNAKLTVIQGVNNDSAMDVHTIKAQVVEDLFKDNQMKIHAQQTEINELEKLVQKYKDYNVLSSKIAPELTVLYPSVKRFSITQTVEVDVKSLKPDTITLAILNMERDLEKDEKGKLEEWLKARVGAKNLRLIIE